MTSPAPIVNLERSNKNNPNVGSSSEIHSDNNIDLPIAFREGKLVLDTSCVTLYPCKTYHPQPCIQVYSL